jgi:hypothetical protein
LLFKTLFSTFGNAPFLDLHALLALVVALASVVLLRAFPLKTNAATVDLAGAMGRMSRGGNSFRCAVEALVRNVRGERAFRETQ